MACLSGGLREEVPKPSPLRLGRRLHPKEPLRWHPRAELQKTKLKGLHEGVGLTAKDNGGLVTRSDNMEAAGDLQKTIIVLARWFNG